MPVCAHAVDAQLDRTFGSFGWTQLNPSPRRDGGTRVAIQPDGKIVLAGFSDAAATGDWVVARFTASGALDPTFGTAGIAPGFGSSAFTGDVALQPDGKIVVCGVATSDTNPTAVVARYASDGSFDPSFGAGGVAAIDVASGEAVYEVPTGIVILPDGRIVVVGYHYDNFDPENVFTMFAFRLLANGAADPTFGVAGMAAMSVPSDGIPSDVALQTDGAIVVGGVDRTPPGSAMLIRLDASGTYDPSFGDGGLVLSGSGNPGTRVGTAVHLDVDGRILLGGYVGTSAAIARYLPDGSVDPAFAIAGLGLVSDPDDNQISTYDMAVRSDGSIVLVGEVTRAGDPDAADVAIARFDPSGAPDVGFAPGGFLRLVLGNETSVASGVAAQSDDRIVFTGQRNTIGAFTPPTHDTRILLARLGNTCGDGLPDAGEQCDDGNVALGDCCTPGCAADAAGVACGPGDTDPCRFDACDGAGTCVTAQPEEAGTACGVDTGDPCTLDGCDGAGTCTTGFPKPAGTPCDGADDSPCTVDACDGAGACALTPPIPPSACLAPTLPAKSALLLLDRPEGVDRLTWKWTKGPAVTDFGAPADTTDYALCLFVGSTLVRETPIPAGAGWTATSKGWLLRREAETAPGGIGRAKLTFGSTGKSRIIIKGRGPLLALPALPLTLPVRMALVSSDGACFDAPYPSPRVDTDTRYRAKGP